MPQKNEAAHMVKDVDSAETEKFWLTDGDVIGK